MSEVEVEVAPISYKVLPKEVTDEIGSVKLLYGITPGTPGSERKRTEEARRMQPA